MNHNDREMTFKGYLETQGINNSTPGPEAYVYAAISAMRPDITYREASLIFADLPVISDAFEALWYGYEDALDLLRPVEGSEIDTVGIFNERFNKDPEPVSVITGRVLDVLRQRYSIE